MHYYCSAKPTRYVVHGTAPQIMHLCFDRFSPGIGVRLFNHVTKQLFLKMLAIVHNMIPTPLARSWVRTARHEDSKDST